MESVKNIVKTYLFSTYTPFHQKRIDLAKLPFIKLFFIYFLSELVCMCQKYYLKKWPFDESSVFIRMCQKYLYIRSCMCKYNILKRIKIVERAEKLHIGLLNTILCTTIIIRLNK